MRASIRASGAPAFLALALAASCGEPEPAGPDPLDEAIHRGIAYFDDLVIDSPSVPMFLAVVHRRFGVPKFAGMLAVFDGLVAQMPRPAPDVLSGRGILDASTPVDAELLKGLVSPINKITHPALHCDRVELPRRYPNRLTRFAAKGGYELTHVALALIWLKEKGHAAAIPDGLEAEVIADTTELLHPEDGVTDLEIEAATFLYGLGRGDAVPASFVDAVLAAQLPDGGWPPEPAAADGSDWHTTCLAVWLLLEVRRPESSKGPLLP